MVHLGSRAFVLEDDRIWFSNFSFNGLFCLELETGEIELVHKFESVADHEIGSHGFAYKEGDEIILIPLSFGDVIVYNVKTKKEHVVRLPARKGFCVQTYKIGTKIWMIPSISTDNVLVYDIVTKTVMLDKKMQQTLYDYSEGEEWKIFGERSQNRFILCSPGKKKICEVDLDTTEAEFLNIPIEDDIFEVVCDGADYWVLLMKSQDVYKWIRAEEKCERYRVTEEKWVQETCQVPYSQIVFADNNILLMNYYAQHIMRIDKEKKIVEKAFDYPADFRIMKELEWGAVFTGAVHDDERLCMVPCRGSHVLLYDLQKRLINGIELVIDKNKISYLENVIEKNMRERCVVESEEMYGLRRFLGLSMQSGNKGNPDGETGKNIYSFLKDFC